MDFDTGLEAIAQLKKLFNTEELTPIALRWILMHPQVTTVIPGASSPEQVIENIKASQLPPFSQEQMDGVTAIYDKFLKESIHPLW